MRSSIFIVMRLGVNVELAGGGSVILSQIGLKEM